jgi:hypothetical protein
LEGEYSKAGNLAGIKIWRNSSQLVLVKLNLAIFLSIIGMHINIMLSLNWAMFTFGSLQKFAK